MTVDIESIIRKAAPEKARFIPGFAFDIMRRVFRQDFCNTFLARNLKGTDFCLGVLDYLDIKLNVEGLDNVPFNADKPLVFVSNHPLGAIDGVALIGTIASHSNDRVKCIVRSELMLLDGLEQFCIPIKKSGKQVRDLPHQVDSAFSGPDHVLLFPAGICSRRINGVVQDIPWRKFFVNKCRQWQRDVLPIHFVGQNSERFYRIDRVTKILHLKLNLAQITLPDEMYRAKGQTFTIRFGKPIPYTTFDSSKTPSQWAEWVKDRVYEL